MLLTLFVGMAIVGQRLLIVNVIVNVEELLVQRRKVNVRMLDFVALEQVKVLLRETPCAYSD